MFGSAERALEGRRSIWRAEQPGGRPGCGAGARPPTSTHLLPPADISELDLPSTVRLAFPQGTDHLSRFEVSLTPGAAGRRCAFSHMHRRHSA